MKVLLHGYSDLVHSYERCLHGLEDEDLQHQKDVDCCGVKESMPGDDETDPFEDDDKDDMMPWPGRNCFFETT